MRNVSPAKVCTYMVQRLIAWPEKAWHVMLCAFHAD